MTSAQQANGRRAAGTEASRDRRPARRSASARTGTNRTGTSRRLVDRRRKIIRDRVHRRRRLLGLVLAVAALGYVLLEVSRSSLFGLSGVEVRGTAVLEQATVVDAAGVDLGEPVLELDLAAIRSRVEALPWVAHAAVTRVPTTGLRIGVTEHRPAASIASQGQFWLVAADGTVLAPAPDGRPADVLYIAGVPSDPGTLEPGFRLEEGSAFGNALAAYSGMDPQLRRMVRGVTAETVEGLRFGLDSGIELVYGVAERQAAKDTAALLVLRHARAEGKEVGTVDVRAPSTPALTTANTRRKSPTVADAAAARG